MRGCTRGSGSMLISFSSKLPTQLKNELPGWDKGPILPAHTAEEVGPACSQGY